MSGDVGEENKIVEVPSEDEQEKVSCLQENEVDV